MYTYYLKAKFKLKICKKKKKKRWGVEFHGSPVVRTPHFHCQGPGFNP